MRDKIPLSAIVVGYNEADQLESLLSSIDFCDEIIYFDLGSKDSSIAIASKFRAQIIKHERVPGCEWIHSAYAQTTKNEWVLIADPDEKLDYELGNQIIKLFKLNLLSDNIGSITAPWIFHFKKTILKGTPWGGVNNRVLLVNNERFKFSSLVHVGRALLPGFKNYEIEYSGLNGIQHYWMRSYKKLFEKHLRYLKNEGYARFQTGQRTTLKHILAKPIKAFRFAYFQKKGYKDKSTGLFLSLFWAWYESVAHYKLYKYTEGLEKNGE